MPRHEVCQFRLALTTWATDRSIGTAYRTERACMMASTSSRWSGLPLPAPPMNPPWVEAPGTIIRIAEPMLAICAVMTFRVPSPSTTVTKSAATPMITPSAVSPDRNRLRSKLRNASRNAMRNIMGTPPVRRAIRPAPVPRCVAGQARLCESGHL